MEHILDNPVWNALISGNKHLSYGNDEVRFFHREVSPFVAFKENTTDHFQILFEILPDDCPALIVSPVELTIPNSWKVLNFVKGIQMVCNTATDMEEPKPNLKPLTIEHVPQMVALAKLTNPGPFESRTIEFGHYFGVFDDEKLIAMAGQRMHAFDYAEVSAVCTHPDYTGKGYAKQLMLQQLHRMRGIGVTPFLHVRTENARAINVYEHLGFTKRTDAYFYFMRKVR